MEQYYHAIYVYEPGPNFQITVTVIAGAAAFKVRNFNVYNIFSYKFLNFLC